MSFTRRASGRPKAANPKRNYVMVRMTDALVQQVDAYAREQHMSRSAAVCALALAALAALEQEGTAVAVKNL